MTTFACDQTHNHRHVAQFHVGELLFPIKDNVRNRLGIDKTVASVLRSRMQASLRYKKACGWSYPILTLNKLSRIARGVFQIVQAKVIVRLWMITFRRSVGIHGHAPLVEETGTVLQFENRDRVIQNDLLVAGTHRMRGSSARLCTRRYSAARFGSHESLIELPDCITPDPPIRINIGGSLECFDRRPGLLAKKTVKLARTTEIDCKS